VTVAGFAVEVQVRTTLQDLWAQLCERLADDLGDPEIKYGGGPWGVQDLLADNSERIATIETLEAATVRLRKEIVELPDGRTAVDRAIVNSIEKVEALKADLKSALKESMDIVRRAKIDREQR